MNDNGRAHGFGFGRKVEAQYTPSSDPMYRHNCYIEALPPPLETEEVIKKMQRFPGYDDSERRLPPLERIYAVQKLSNCIVPLPDYIEIEKKFSRMLLNGYFARNPLSAEWVKQMQSAFPGIGEDALVRSNAAGFAIYGTSGVGKTTVIESILSLYPQVIIHTQYNGNPFDQQQIVWLKLDCPFDGSPRGLCINFFQGIDRVLGTRYTDKLLSKRVTADLLLPKMAEVAGECGLGVLVLDEVQRLKGAGEKLLSFFVQLTNVIGVPVLMSGTYKAMSMFKDEAAAARRVAGQGDVVMDNFADDEVWRHLLKKLWRYQYTDIPTPLSDKLINAFHEQSQGITDIAVKLYMFAQWQVIGTGDEKITPKLVEVVAKENLHAMGPILRALRTHDFEALSKIEDIRSPWDMDLVLKNACRQAHLSGAMATIRNETLAENSDAEVGSLPHEKLALQLVQAGFDGDIARIAARKACDRFAAQTDMKRASVEAFRLAQEADDLKKEARIAQEMKKPAGRKKAPVVSLSGDLREIVKHAEKATTPYEALKNAGVIKSPYEFFSKGANNDSVLSQAAS
ncbi:hypothetical protein GMLC_13500 [Geomonas limicola]|uniref:AAA+ ATPase domain-containing protein n=1 Tax=Geomonas limicola TaxID=2740186 RepID=A0A6V8N5P4_9BACT|nr:ATP-binding protein [Geomonas limicola]GFO67771.1 hypothetical protein GMLC_13500 [Geomonas limicola]